MDPPAGWAKHFDQAHQKYYYHSVSTAQTRWEYPAIAPVQPEGQQQAAQQWELHQQQWAEQQEALTKAAEDAAAGMAQVAKRAAQGLGIGGGVLDEQKEVRPGDWRCPTCDTNVFASKDVCFKCRTPKPMRGEVKTQPTYDQTTAADDEKQARAAARVAQAVASEERFRLANPGFAQT